ncbi:MAG: type IV secretion system DNA-binding domain-containing protein [Candidatus Saccharimonadales bacterium]
MPPQLSSLITWIFGDSPLEVFVSCALFALIALLIWRLIVRPTISVASSIRAIFKNNDLVALEITPPKTSTAHPLNTQSLFSTLHQQLGKHDVVSLEIIGTKKKGIRYRVVAPSWYIPSIQKHLASYMPELRFKHATINLAAKGGTYVFTIVQARHFAYPLKPHEDLEKTDPIAFIAGSLTRLENDEEVTLQLAMRRYSSDKARRIHHQILEKGRTAILYNDIGHFLRTYSILVFGPAIIIGLLANSWQVWVTATFIIWTLVRYLERQGPEKQLTKREEEIFSEIAAKLEQPLLQTDIRFGVYSSERPGTLVDEFVSSLGPLNTTNFQVLQLRFHRYINKWWQRYMRILFSRRLTSVLPYNSSVLSAAELATLFHFPYGTIKTEGMVRSHSRTLPAPLSLLGDPDLDVVIGVNKHHGAETPIGITASERERHMFVVGGTGSGKTTMLKYQIIQDIQSGKGVAVVDPHGDLAEELLDYIPEERAKDLIYLNPDDLDHAIGVNLLELPEGLKGNDLLREKDRITESVISVMRKVFSEDDSGGHRIEYVLRNTIHTALTLEKPTLFTIFRLLNDGKFAKSAIKNLEDEDLKAFWKNELGKAGSMQKVKMAAGITAKIGRFLFSASARAMLEQEKSTINFDEILDGKILICNFSKGRLGEDTSMLFGVTILAKLQLAALKRSEKKQLDRKPFYLYVDEFQNFATLSFTQMLSEARKYKVFLTMAEQSTQQQDDQKMVNIILANVGTVVAFRTGSPKDEELLLPLLEPYIEKGEISNLSAYNFYCRISGVETQEPMSGETIVL